MHSKIALGIHHVPTQPLHEKSPTRPARPRSAPGNVHLRKTIMLANGHISYGAQSKCVEALAGRTFATPDIGPRLTLKASHSTNKNSHGSLLHQVAAADDGASVAAILASTYVPTRSSGEPSALADTAVPSTSALELRDAYGRTPLHEAAFHGAAQATRVLLAAGASVSSRSNHGETPLHDAATALPKHRKLEVAWRLLDAGAPVNAGNHSGDTPLHSAAQFGFVALCCLLIQRMADVGACGASGLTALDIAISRGRQGVIGLLQAQRKLRFHLLIPEVAVSPDMKYDIVGSSGEGLLDKVAHVVPNVTVWVSDKAPVSEICGRMSQALGSQLLYLLGWPPCVWHRCEFRRRRLDASPELSASRHITNSDDCWKTLTCAEDLKIREGEDVQVRLVPSGCTRIADAVQGSVHTSVDSGLPWRFTYSAASSDLEWEERPSGWRVTKLKPGHPIEVKLRAAFGRQAKRRTCVPGSVRLLRNEQWRCAFESTMSALEGALSQPARHDPELWNWLNEVSENSLDQSSKPEAFEAWCDSAYKSTGSTSYRDRFLILRNGTKVHATRGTVNTKYAVRKYSYPISPAVCFHRLQQDCEHDLDAKLVGFHNVHRPVLVWQGAGVGGRLTRCLEEPGRILEEIESPVHVSSSPDFAVGCGTRPSFLADGLPEGHAGTVFLFICTSRFVFPLSDSRTYIYHFHPLEEPNGVGLVHRGLRLAPGFDSHMFGIRNPGVRDNDVAVSYASFKEPVAAHEIVVMDVSQLFPVAAIDFVHRSA